jgi:hypothetical protein
MPSTFLRKSQTTARNKNTHSHYCAKLKTTMRGIYLNKWFRKVKNDDDEDDDDGEDNHQRTMNDE